MQAGRRAALLSAARAAAVASNAASGGCDSIAELAQRAPFVHRSAGGTSRTNSETRRMHAAIAAVVTGVASGVTSASAAADASVGAQSTSVVFETDAPVAKSGTDLGALRADRWQALVEEIRCGDEIRTVRAVETLVAVANDMDNHPGLVRAGAIPALVAAYRSGDAHAALNVNLLRALADISRSHANHADFKESRVQHMLAAVLTDVGVVEPSGLSGWLTWAGSFVGLGGRSVWGDMPKRRKPVSDKKISSSDASKVESGSELHPLSTSHGLSSVNAPSQEAAPGDLLGPSLISGTTPALEVGTVDLRGGIIYHATRCLANIARETSTHDWLMSADVLSPMICLLNAVPMRELASAATLADVVGDEQRADTVRFAALSVAALSKSSAGRVLEIRGHVPLIALLGQCTDSVAQMYAAGGIRNLARRVESDLEGTWRAHRQLVVDGVAPALATALGVTSNTQTQVFCCLSLGDLLTTGHSKSSVICKRLIPTFESFAELLASGNAGVARSSQRVLHNVLSTAADAEGLVLSEDGKKKFSPLCESVSKHVGPLVRGPATKGDATAMGCIAALTLCDVLSDSLVAKGVVSTLVDALPSKNEYGQRAMIALARLSNRSQHVTEIVLRGGLRAAMARGSAGAEDSRWEAAALANMARVERNRPDIGHGGLPILIRAMHSKNADARREGARGLFNLTIGGVSRVLSAQGGALIPLTRIANTMDGAARKYAVGAIAAISELQVFGANIVELNTIAILLKAVEADKTLARDVARCFAQLSNHVESHEALARDGAATWLVSAVSRGDAAADTLHHAASGLCNIAYTSGLPREALRKAGAASALTGLSSGIYPPHVAHCARIALANLRGVSPPVLQHAEPHGQVDPV